MLELADSWDSLGQPYFLYNSAIYVLFLGKIHFWQICLWKTVAMMQLWRGVLRTKTCMCQNGKPKNQSKEYLFGDDDHIIVQKVPYNYRLFGKFVIINHR